jgi:membrane protein
VAVGILRALAQARGSERRGLTMDELAHRLQVDPLHAEPVVHALRALDWVAWLEEPDAPRLVLLVDPALTPARPLVALLLLDPAPPVRAFWRRAGFADMTVGELLIDA